ncbi:MAG: hypothetical protein M0R74_11295 [Dehalococcoidia bacterium]|nr:hypothetical protein [Dehalococcoidia bacterium]
MNEADPMTWEMATFLVGSLAFLALVAVVVVWQIFATWRSKMSVAREEAYRALAEASAAAHQRTADELRRTARVLEDLQVRTAEMERLLKEVG